MLTNAVKFTDQGYIRVDIDAQFQAGRQCVIYASIADSGIGIPSEILSTMFQPFTQADSSISRRFGGTGLGLAISKRLCELMNGQLWATSRAGVGSTFFCTVKTELPISSSKQPSHRDAREYESMLAHPHDKRLHILLVEDNVTNQKVALHVLKRMGHNVDVAGNGCEAVEAVARHSFDVVLMDIQMPEMDGLEATRRIRQLKLNQQPYIIAMTASAFEEDRQNSLNAGMDDFVTKPIRARDISVAIRRLKPLLLA